MTSHEPPSAEELQRELELVRAAQPSSAIAPATTGGAAVGKALGVIVLWVVLIGVFVAIWQFFSPDR